MSDVIGQLYIDQVDKAASQDAIKDSRILSPEMEILADVAAAPLKIQVVLPLHLRCLHMHVDRYTQNARTSCTRFCNSHD